MLNNKKMTMFFVSMLTLLGLSLTGCMLPGMAKGFYVAAALVLFVAFTIAGSSLIYYAFEEKPGNFCEAGDYEKVYTLTR